MDTDEIFVKTAKGVEEVEKRTYHLNFRLRTALIPVDGHSPVVTLLAKIPGDGLALLAELARDGFIAPADGHVMTTAETETATTPTAVAAPEFNLEDAKMRAARSIETLLGPNGDDLAVAIERTKSFAEFAARAERTRDMISQMRGASRAKEFWAATGLQ